MKLITVIAVVFAMTLPLGAKEKQDPKTPTPEAKALMAEVKEAYGKLESLKMNGRLSVDLDVAGTTNQEAIDFVSQYKSPNQYRHEVPGDVVTGSTGQKQYVHSQKKNMFAVGEASQEKGSYRQLPGDLGQILEVQNPSLAMAVSKNSVEDLIDQGNSRSVRVLETPAGDEGATVAPTLAYTAGDGREITLSFSPQTHLLQSATVDMSNMLRNRGAQQVKKALIKIDYSSVEANKALDTSTFAWAPPAGGREVPLEAEYPVMKLQGKSAPDFTLSDLSGKQVKLSDLKGNVVLLDFWATWCPPCVRSLPDIAAIHQAHKDSNVKVFAINAGEEKAEIQSFLAQSKIDVPVLMDSDESTMERYGIQGIPTTIVIRPDGVVQKVVVGVSPGGKEELERELDAAAAANSKD